MFHRTLFLIEDIINAINKLHKEKNQDKINKIIINLNNMWFDLYKLLKIYVFYKEINADYDERYKTFLNYTNRVKQICDNFIDNKNKEITTKNNEDLNNDILLEFVNNFNSKFVELNKYYNHDTTRYNYIFYVHDYNSTSDMYSQRDIESDNKVKVIKNIIDIQNKKRVYNIMLSNLEFNVKTLKELSDCKDDYQIRFYGNYQANTITTDTRKLLDKVAIGDKKDFLIRNNSVDIILHRYQGDIVNENEKSAIIKDIERLSKYLRNNGILLFEVPLELLFNKDILAITKYYTVLGASKMDCSVPLNYVLLALKSRNKISDEDKEKNYQYLRNLINNLNSWDDLTKYKEDWLLPKSDFGAINLFRGGETDILLLNIAFENSKLKDKLFIEKPKTEMRPLLPLQKGQIGQIIASGKLNGVIEENNTYKHIIKGVIYKGFINSFEEIQDGIDIVRTTHNLCSNMIEINALGGNGVFREITTVHA